MVQSLKKRRLGASSMNLSKQQSLDDVKEVLTQKLQEVKDVWENPVEIVQDIFQFRFHRRLFHENFPDMPEFMQNFLDIIADLIPLIGSVHGIFKLFQPNHLKF